MRMTHSDRVARSTHQSRASRERENRSLRLDDDVKTSRTSSSSGKESQRLPIRLKSDPSRESRESRKRNFSNFSSGSSKIGSDRELCLLESSASLNFFFAFLFVFQFALRLRSDRSSFYFCPRLSQSRLGLFFVRLLCSFSSSENRR
jgi:hypothetical protein